MSKFLFCLLIPYPTPFFSNLALQCKSWLQLLFLRSDIREKWGWGKVLAAKNKKSDTEFWSEFLTFPDCVNCENDRIFNQSQYLTDISATSNYLLVFFQIK